MPSAKWCPFRPGLTVLDYSINYIDSRFCDFNLEFESSKLILRIDIFSIPCEISHR